MDPDYDAQGTWFRRHGKTLIALLIILGLAAFFRVGFNYEPAVGDGTYRYAGNDDYYHLRVVQHVTANGEHLLDDPLLNYPNPAGNPRPPLYDWHVAVLGRLIDLTTGMDSVESASYALEWGSALWGILTAIPVWLIGRAVYSNRAGLWAGFLVAASAAHIQRSGFGLGDHDALILFLLTLGAYFLIRALEFSPAGRSYGDWKSLDGAARALGGYALAHKQGMAYALLAGFTWSLIGLTWEGYPYVVAIYAVYYAFQLVGNHMRRQDSSGDVLVMLGVMVPVTLFPTVFYWTQGNVGSTVNAHAYILVGLVILTLALVPTRDLPSLLVLPALGLSALIGFLLLRAFLPDVATQLLSANGYFIQSKIYTTIAEAQRTELGVFVFSIGFMTFFLALVGFFYALFRYWKTKARDQLYLVAWAFVSFYMAFAALRFVFNAAPVFAVLAGWMVAKIVDWMDLRQRVRDFQSLRHDSWAKATRSVFGGKQVGGAVFILFLLIVPNLWFSFDAGFPGEARARFRDHFKGNEFFQNQTGVFGQSLLGDEWVDVYGWLNTQDHTEWNIPEAEGGRPQSCEERPAHMAWWDYGFWEVALACHPTVADNFQNGVDIAGRAIAAQSEKELIELFTIRVLEGHWRQNARTYSSPVVEAFRSLNATLPDQLPKTWSVATYDSFRLVLDANLKNETDAAGFYVQVSDAADRYIGYYLVDHRMMPIDFEGTAGIDSGSIFYAPIFLANKNPDDFAQTVYVDQQGQEYAVQTYGVTAQGDSHQLDEQKIIGPDGKRYTIIPGSLIRVSDDGLQIDYEHNGGLGTPLSQDNPIKLKFKDAFYATMFYRAYVGGDGQSPGPNQNYHLEFYQDQENGGNGLQHFRLVHSSQVDRTLLKVNLLKFYWGAPLSGRIETQGQTPIANARVSAFDDFGIRHDTTVTDPNGRYDLLLPFGLRENGTLKPITVRVERGGAEIGRLSLNVSEAQAMRKVPFNESGDLTITTGGLNVFAYVDVNRDGVYTNTTDLPAARSMNATVEYGESSEPTDETGHAILNNVLPGRSTLSGTMPGHSPQAQQIEVKPGETVVTNLTFTRSPIPVNVSVLAAGTSEPVSDLLTRIVADNPNVDYTQNATGTTDFDGNFTVSLTPGGSYHFEINATKDEGGRPVRYYTQGQQAVEVQVGSRIPPVEVYVFRDDNVAA